jgi:HlyD family secretion protein
MASKLITGPRITAALVVLALAMAVWFMLRKPAIEVEVAAVTRGDLAVTVDDLGETRVRDLFTVASPVSGELLRLPLKPGAEVVAGKTLLAEIQPGEPDPIDARAYAQTVATVSSLEASLAAARARVQEVRAAERLAAADYGRVEALLGKGFVTRARFDQARADLARSRAASAEARQAEDAALHNLQAGQAMLRRQGGTPRGQAVAVRAPVSGFVLRVLQESRRPVVAGTQLLEIGDPGALEIVSDMLSADAVRVRPGAAVSIEGWGGATPLKGKVRLVEPYGFTKISALGVEEQRVNVVIDLTDPRAAWERLGHGYRARVRIALWAAPDVLRVPVGALFRQGQGWAAFTIDREGRARLVAVEAGQMNDELAEVRGGLTAGQRVILHPGEKVGDGVKVSPAS